MLLAIDVGNTQTVIGLFGDDPEADSTARPHRAPARTGLLDHWRIATQRRAHRRRAGAAGAGVPRLPRLLASTTTIDGIAISSVVPRVTAAFREMTERYFGFQPGRASSPA